MSQMPRFDSRTGDPSIEISRSDLLAAWSILENLAVSLDQIGGVFGGSVEGTLDEETRFNLLIALNNYLSSGLVENINNARVRLGRYLEDDEAEALSEQINYWDYGNPGG